MISEKQKQEIFNLRQQKLSILEISIKLKLGKATVYEWCNKFDPNKNFNLTNKIKENEKNIICEFYIKNNFNLHNTYLNFIEIASKASIRDLLIKRNIYKGSNKKTNEEKLKHKSKQVIKWKKDKRLELIEYKGGKCEICNYNKCYKALEFHHINPKEKDFNISTNSFAFERMKKEVDKCMLLCCNCHREIHHDILIKG